MFKQLALLLLIAASAWAQDDADLPKRFEKHISPDLYFKLRSDYLNLLRGLPADPGLRDEAVRRLQASKFSATALTPAWTSLGPAPIPNGQNVGALPVSGRVTAFVIDPTHTNKVYLGTAQGGVYRSLDSGANFTQIFDSAASSAIGALALAPSNPSILYVGTGEANGSGDSYAGVGLYRIDNCDTTATLAGPINPVRNYFDGLGNPRSVPAFNGRSIASILVHPTDPSTVFVGVVSGVIGIGGDPALGGTVPPLGMRGLYRLTNATGAPGSIAVQKLTVTLAAAGFDTPNTGNRNVSSMVFDPADPNILTAWVVGTTAAGDGGIYRSTNALSANPTFTQVLTTATTGARGELAVYKQGNNPSVLYAATGEAGSGRLRVSTDGGLTWSPYLAGAPGFCGGQCFYNIGLAVLPGPTPAQNDDIILIGGNVPGTGSFLFGKSTDGGATFTESSDGLHADTHFIRIDPANPNVVYHGDDGGIFKSTNGGISWSSLNSAAINTVQFQGLAVHPTDPKWSIGGTQDNGTNMRRADGSWTRVDFGDGGYALIDRNATDTTNITLYHTYFNQTGGLIGFGRILSAACAFDINAVGVVGWSFRGVYGGGSADPTPNCDSTDKFNGIPLSDPVLFYAPMEVGPGNPSTLYFGAGKLYRSTDKGDTMSAVSQSANAPVSTIAVSPQDDKYRLIGRSDGTIFYTTTGANPMVQLTGIPARFVGRAKFDPGDKNTAYITLGGYFGGTASTQSHVWKISNLNTTPVVLPINNGLPDVPVNAFAVDPANSSALFAGTDIGVYGSTDGGASWSPYGTGLPVVAVFGAEIQPQSRKLRIATHGRGMWDIDLPAPPPDLTLTKSHSAPFIQGQAGAAYTLTVNNIGLSPTSATVTLTDTLPPDLTATSMSGAGWNCTLASLTCTRSDVLNSGASYPPVTLKVNVALSAAPLIVNNASVSGGGETNTNNDSASDPTVVLNGSSSQLIVNYRLVSSQPAAGGRAYFTYMADLLNPGMAFGSVTATASSIDPFALRVVPGQNQLLFAPVPARSQTPSKNSFTILGDPNLPFDPTKLSWTFQTTPAAPVAIAGDNLNVSVGAVVTLDGSGSLNPSGQGTLSYQWAFVSRPPGSTAKLLYLDTPLTQFTANVQGTYIVSLTVTNGIMSNTILITIVASPNPVPLSSPRPRE